jgi:hypothetical protein
VAQEFYLAQPENFTLLIDHSFLAPLARKAASSRDSEVKSGNFPGGSHTAATKQHRSTTDTAGLGGQF